jgi:MFS family permease
MPSHAEAPVNDDGCCLFPSTAEATTQHNLRVESIFSACNGVFMGMIIFAAPFIVLTCLGGGILELTIITCAFPCGAFLGPLWAGLGRRWGMKKLVLQMAIWANLPLFLMFWVEDVGIFTAIITVSQLLHSAMRMGMSSMYRATYPRSQMGRILGKLIFFQFLTMVPTVLIAGWLSDPDAAGSALLYPLTLLKQVALNHGFPPTRLYQLLYPLAALAGLLACPFYARLRLLEEPARSKEFNSVRDGLRSIHRVIVNDRAYMLFQLAFFLAGSSFFMSFHVTQKLAHDVLEFGAAELSLWLFVVPQIMLALCSPFWGRFMDRIGIVRARWVISAIMTVYLSCYFGGTLLGLPFGPLLIYAGSFLRGVAEGGGQVTWAMASVHFAPTPEDVPVYNGIHFVLNGIRGLAMPFVGSGLYWLLGGPWAILLGVCVSASSLFVISRTLPYEQPTENATEEMSNDQVPMTKECPVSNVQ